MIMVQKCIIFIQKLTLINAWLCKIIKRESWVMNMILLIYFLKHNYDDWFENKESTDTTRKSNKEESSNRI